MKTDGGLWKPWLVVSALWALAAGAAGHCLAGLKLASAIFWLVVLAPPAAAAGLFCAAVWIFAGVFME